MGKKIRKLKLCSWFYVSTTKLLSNVFTFLFKAAIESKLEGSYGTYQFGISHGKGNDKWLNHKNLGLNSPGAVIHTHENGRSVQKQNKKVHLTWPWATSSRWPCLILLRFCENNGNWGKPWSKTLLYSGFLLKK